MFATLTNTEALCTGRLHRNLPESTKNMESSASSMFCTADCSQGMLVINRCRIFCLL